ncbi:unnamed protein product [Trichobilharzia szidati]|nr:unnamed protein product [Trichobilharzia szidati]
MSASFLLTVKPSQVHKLYDNLLPNDDWHNNAIPEFLVKNHENHNTEIHLRIVALIILNTDLCIKVKTSRKKKETMNSSLLMSLFVLVAMVTLSHSHTIHDNFYPAVIIEEDTDRNLVYFFGGVIIHEVFH